MSHEDLFRLHLSGLGEYNGNELIISPGTTIEFVDGMSKYIIYKYWISGRLHRKDEYSYGKLHGKQARCYSSGQPYATCIYVDGKKHGEHIEYDYDGHIYVRCNYTNNQLHGRYVVYSRNNESICKSFNYVRGVIDDS